MSQNTEFKFRTNSPEETRQLGQIVASLVQPGDVVLLHGDLGAGKTQWVQGMARAWEISEDIISPTYVIVIPYVGTQTLYHADAYRIKSDDEVFELGFDELLAAGGILVVEWGSKIAHLLPSIAIDVTIETIDETARRIIVAIKVEASVAAAHRVLGSRVSQT